MGINMEVSRFFQADFEANGSMERTSFSLTLQTIQLLNVLLPHVWRLPLLNI